MTTFVSLPNTILIPLLICAGVVVFFGVMDTIAWIRFKAKQNEPARKAKAAEKAQKAEEARQAKAIEEAKSASSVSEGANSANSTGNSENGVMAASSNSSVIGGDNLANSASNAEGANAISATNAMGAMANNDSSSMTDSAHNEGVSSSQNASNGSSMMAGAVGGAILGAAATSAASNTSSESVSIAAEEGTVSENVASVSSNGDAMCGVVSSTPGFAESEPLCNPVVAATSDTNSSIVTNDHSAIASYSDEAANAGAIYGIDGVAGHGSFLLFAFLGGDIHNDYYDYYVSPFGDKRRCLYHLYPTGERKIVFDEALVEGEFFPADYYEYFDEENGGRSRVHMIDGVAGEKEDANFFDPFASSYDIAAYDENSQRRLTHYEGESSITEQAIADPDIALNRDYTYKDGSGVDHLRHNRLAEQSLEEVSVVSSPIEEVTPEPKKSYKKRVPFLVKLANSDEKLQSQYAEIKELMLSYKTHERASIPCDTYSKHRLVYLKAEVYGKHLNLALRLNPKDYANSTIPTKDVSDKKIYVETPLMVQVRSDLSLRRAKKLIVDMMGNDTKADEESEETAPVEEAPLEEDESGEMTKKALKPRVPFATKLEQADDVLKNRYAEIKDEMEAYGVHSRISIPCDTYSLHRQDYLKLTIDGKSLKAFFHLAPKDYDGTPIPHEDQSSKKAYVDTPLLLHISSDLALRRAKILIADMMAKADLSKKESK
jgi:hypothetical protein